MKEERWPKGAAAVNHRASPTYIVKVTEKGSEEVVVLGWRKLSKKPRNEALSNGAAVRGIRVCTEGAITPLHKWVEPH